MQAYEKPSKLLILLFMTIGEMNVTTYDALLKKNKIVQPHDWFQDITAKVSVSQ